MQTAQAKQAADLIYRITELNELLALNKLIVQQTRALGKRATRQFVKGQKVKFHSSKYNRTVLGTIVKVGYKNLRVQEANTTWRVSAALCEAA